MRIAGLKSWLWLSIVLLAGCSNRGGLDDGGSDGGFDAGDREYSPLRIGSDETLEIATWNIQNFPANSATAARVATLIADMDIDLVAVQEIADQAAFEQILAQLDSHAGVLSDHEYSSGEYQKTGFIYRKNMIRVRGTESIFEWDGYAFPRPPLKVQIEVTGLGETLTMDIINVHLKADTSQESEDRRRDACEKLKEHVDAIINGGLESEVIILGDFNDSLDDDPQDNVFSVFLDDPATYEFTSQELVDQGEFSLVPWQNLLDHIVISADLQDEYLDGHTLVKHLDTEIYAYDYVDEVSDHRPVVAIFPMGE